MKQIITLFLFVLAFSTSSYASKATVVPMVNKTTVNVDMAKKQGVFKNIKSFVANTAKKAMDGKTVAIIATLLGVGTLIAWLINKDNPSDIGSFYIRQSIGLILLAVVVGVLATILAFIPFGGIISLVLYLGFLILWVINFINAVGGKQKPIPLVGKLFQDWFAGI